MSKSNGGDKSKKSQRKKDKLEAPANYEVGKGKPPKENQFKPGKSGNPAGRPKGSTNLKKIIYEMGSLDIDIVGPDGKQTVSRNEAAALKFWSMSLSGHFLAMKYLCEINAECFAKRGEGRMTQQEYEAQIVRLLAKTILDDSKVEEFEQLLYDPGMGRTVVPNNYKDEDDD